MNERIKLLAEQAGYKHPDAVGMIEDYAYFDHEKFAELIVKECIQTLHNNTPVFDENESLEDFNQGYIRAILDCEYHIIENLGVES